jgi:hypothetical protein
MLPIQSLEAITRAKKLEMEYHRANTNWTSGYFRSKPRNKKRKIDLLVKVAIQPKFSVGVTLVRGFGR